MRRKLLLLLAFFAPGLACCQKGQPLLTGYVTAINPSGTFELDSGRIELQPGATFSRRTGNASVTLPELPAPFLGEVFDCYGRFDAKRNVLLVKHLAEVVPVPGSIASRGMIEVVTTGPTNVVRADGFLLHLTPATQLHFEDDLKLETLGPNQWIAYKGTLHPDGSVDVTEATIWRNAPEAAEAKLRDKQDFNPNTGDIANPQSGLSKAVLGVDPRKLPTHQDPILQARLDRIGNALVPAFVRALDPRDPSRIPFRFRAVDSRGLRYPIALTSGIILIPYDSIQRLPQDTDDQLAALLADSIAIVLEKQKYLNKDKHATLTTASLVSTALMASPLGLAALPLGMAGNMTASNVNGNLYTHEMEQSGRVSLWLLHDAGYDLAQAPIAWWQLASPKAKPLAEIALPPRTINLYEQLGTTWHKAEPPAANTSQPTAPQSQP